VRATLEVGEEEAGEIGVETFVAGDELVLKGTKVSTRKRRGKQEKTNGESKSGHETTLLEPEDGGEGAREEDTLNGSEGDKALTENRAVVRNPGESPLSLLLDAGDGLDGVEELGALLRLANVGVDEERVNLRVDVLPANRRESAKRRKRSGRETHIIIWKP
jgi:hypothetical protein